MRLFLAIELSDPARQHLHQVCERLRQELRPHGISWVKPENYHVTLKFLGELSEQRLPELTAALSAIPIPEPMKLACSGLVMFPPRGRINVLAAGLQGDVEQVQAIQAQLEKACAAVGFERDSRRYTPHVTLGRCRTGLRADRQYLAKLDIEPAPAFSANGFSLVRSQLDPRGATHETRRRFQAT